jgi:endoglucanase
VLTSVSLQIGDGNADHSVWTRPEDIATPYPVYLITPSKPGSDLAGAMAAALAAAAVVFDDTDPTYAAACLSHARSIYTCAAPPCRPPPTLLSVRRLR